MWNWLFEGIFFFFFFFLSVLPLYCPTKRNTTQLKIKWFAFQPQQIEKHWVKPDLKLINKAILKCNYLFYTVIKILIMLNIAAGPETLLFLKHMPTEKNLRHFNACLGCLNKTKSIAAERWSPQTSLNLTIFAAKVGLSHSEIDMRSKTHWSPASVRPTCELRGAAAVGRRPPCVPEFTDLLHPAAVEALVCGHHVADAQPEHLSLPLLIQPELQLGEATGVVPVQL